MNDVLAIAKYLIQAQSVSPSDGGLMEYMAQYLQKLGFSIERFDINETKNLYAKIGVGPYFCFAGHIDVVPTGPNWLHDPYSAIIEDGYLYGRGTSDMKVSIACAMVAFKEILQKNPNLSLAFLITSDEEAVAQDGLKPVAKILKERNENIELFLLGEPTALKSAGDAVKIGRRGSMTAVLEITGLQGHIAYPELAKNPIPIAIEIAQALIHIDFADYDPIFGASKLQITNIATNNCAENMIPGVVQIMFGIRFNKTQTEESIKQKIASILQNYEYKISWRFHGNAFSIKNYDIVEQLRAHIKSITYSEPVFDAKGATSDGRFLCEIADVIELGFLESMAHKVDEKVSLAEIEIVYKIYKNLFSQLHN